MMWRTSLLLACLGLILLTCLDTAGAQPDPQADYDYTPQDTPSDTPSEDYPPPPAPAPPTKSPSPANSPSPDSDKPKVGPPFPGLDTVITGPFGFQRGTTVSWSEPPAGTEITGITVWKNAFQSGLETIQIRNSGNKPALKYGKQDTDATVALGDSKIPALEPFSIDLTKLADVTTVTLTIDRNDIRAIGIKTADGFERVLGQNMTGDGSVLPPQVIASPCPQGAYKLTAIQGFSNTRDFSKLSFVWKLTNPELFNTSIRNANPWTCKPWLGFARESKSSPGQPECVSFGSGCLEQYCQIQQVDGQCAFDSLPGPPELKLTPQVCVPRKNTTERGTDYDDPTRYCPRASGALGLPVDVPTPWFAQFIILDVCEDGEYQGPAMSVATLKQILYSDPYGMKAYFKDVSFGRAVLDENTTSIKTVRIPCGVTTERGMNAFPSWDNYVRDKGLYDGDDKYVRIGFIGPPYKCGTGAASCTGAGETVSAKVSVSIFGWVSLYFMNYPNTLSNNLYLFKHEIGHTLGLAHTTSSTYGDDSSSPMDVLYPCLLYGAPQLVQQLGWRTEIASLNRYNLRSKTSYEYKLPALSESPRSVIHIKTDWDNITQTIFISVRVAKGQDADILDEYDGKLSIHTSDWVRPEDALVPDVPFIAHDLVALVPVNGTWTLSGMTVQHLSFNTTTSISMVKISRA